MGKYFEFEIPKEGVSREVLEADLSLYLGPDAKVMDSRVSREIQRCDGQLMRQKKSDRYVVHTTHEPPRVSHFWSPTSRC
jgi:hypothetical protein